MMENRLDRTLNYGWFGSVIGKPKPNRLTVFCKPLHVHTYLTTFVIHIIVQPKGQHGRWLDSRRTLHVNLE